MISRQAKIDATDVEMHNCANSVLRSLAMETSAFIRNARYGNDRDQNLALSFATSLTALEQFQLSAHFPGEHEVRALRYAPIIFGRKNITSEIKSLHSAALSAFRHVRWTEFYAEDAWSKGFLPEFANGEGIGPDGRLVNDTVILGLFLLGPSTLYPAHAHPAEEFYIVLDGGADFQVGINDSPRPSVPGSVILHHANVSHSIRTGAEPLFAVYGWQGAIDEPSWYREDMGDDSMPLKFPTIAKS